MSKYPEDKLLSGYMYRLAGVNPTIHTGIGGARMLIDSLKARGASNVEIENAIEVYVRGWWWPLSVVNIKKIKEDDNKPIA